MKFPILVAVGMVAILAACSGKPEPAQPDTSAAAQKMQQAIQHAKEASAQAGEAANKAAAAANENIRKAHEAAAQALANLPEETKQALRDAAAMAEQKRDAAGNAKGPGR